MRFRVLWRPARVRFWLLMQHRVLRRRPSATPILPLTHGLEVVPVINKIDLPSGRRADASRRRSRISSAFRPRTRPEISAKTGHQHSRGARAHRHRYSGAGGRSGCAAAVRSSSTASTTRTRALSFICALMDGTVKPGDEDQNDGHRRRISGARSAAICGRSVCLQQQELCAQARSATSRPSSRRCRDTRVGDTVTACGQSDAGAAARLPAGQPDGILRHLHRRTAPSIPICATRWKNCSSTTQRCRLSRKRSVALGFGFRCGFLGTAAHGDHSGAAGTRVQPRPDHHRCRALSTRLSRPTARPSVIDNPHNYPEPGCHRGGAQSRMSRRPS